MNVNWKQLYLIFLLLLSSSVMFSRSYHKENDTISWFEFARINPSTQNVTSTFRIIMIDSILYDGLNFPFDCMRCKDITGNNINNCYDKYETIIDRKSLRKGIKEINKKLFFRLNKIKETNLPLSFINCLYSKYGNGSIFKKVTVVCSYDIIKCEISRGVSDGLFCEEHINLKEAPIIFKIFKVL